MELEIKGLDTETLVKLFDNVVKEFERIAKSLETIAQEMVAENETI